VKLQRAKAKDNKTFLWSQHGVMKIRKDPPSFSKLSRMSSVDSKVPRISVETLVYLAFPEKRQQNAALKQVGRNEGFPSHNTYPIKRAMDKLEGYVNKSKAKCLTIEKSKTGDLRTFDWRQRFENSEVYRQLPERLIEQQRQQMEAERERTRELKVISNELRDLMQKMNSQLNWCDYKAAYMALEEAKRCLPVFKLDSP